MPLYDKVLKSMQDKIRSGEWAAGEMIPREIDLCAMYDVSRSTIRMAMSRLVDAGALTRVKGMGTYVTVSMAPTAQYIGAVARRPMRRLFHSGITPKIRQTATGKASRRTITLKFQIRPSRWTLSR